MVLKTLPLPLSLHIVMKTRRVEDHVCLLRTRIQSPSPAMEIRDKGRISRLSLS